jgi:hypothetical protein
MKTLILALVFAAVALFAFTPASNVVKASPYKSFNKVTALAPLPVSGTNAFGTFTGNFTLQRFAQRSGQLRAVGTLTGTFTDLLGNVTQVNRLVSIPITAINGTCQILHLELGPLDLNLLGLMIHLDKVVLDITAQQGGGLLGDLLCSIANLLNGGGPLGQIARLLNQILGAL